RSKIANIISTFDLHRRLQGAGVTANCMSPGPTRTRFGHNLQGLPRLFPLTVKRLFPGPETGARTLTWLASSSDVEGESGQFYFRERARRTKPFMSDVSVAARLWQISSELVKLDLAVETFLPVAGSQPIPRSA